MKDILILHIRPENVQNNPKGGVTVAVRKVSPMKFHIGHACCHWKDNFVKALGVAKAVGRLNSNGSVRYVTIEADWDIRTAEGRRSMIQWLRSEYSPVYTEEE